MNIGMIGLGRMGGAMARRLMRGGHSCVVFDRNTAATKALAQEGAIAANSLDDLVQQLPTPRIVWLMLPAGKVTEETVRDLQDRLARADVLIDGGNSHYKDDIARAQRLSSLGIEYVDCGTSGGVWGEHRGYCLMIGGSSDAVRYLDPIFATLAPGEDGISRTPGSQGGTAEKGYLHCGPAGAGHFVKMVHNGIEYGLMQAFAEGFDLLHNSSVPLGHSLPVPGIAEVWRHGSVITAWLLDLTATALARNPDLSEMKGVVADSGEGRWTVEASIEAGVPCPALTAALFTRFRSQTDHRFSEKLLSAMRLGFGGHVESSIPAAK